MYKPTVFVDLDDTLISTQPAYTKALDEASALVGSQLPVEAGAFRELICKKNDEARLAADARTFGNYLWPRAFRDAVDEVAQSCGVSAHYTIQLSDMVAQIAAATFADEFPPLPGVHRALERLRNKGYALVVVTKGEQVLQRSKVHGAGLDSLVDNVEVVGAKNVGKLATIASKYDADPWESWAVGDSPRDDIRPARLLGFTTVLISPCDVGSYNKMADAGPSFAVESFVEAERLIPPAGSVGWE